MHRQAETATALASHAITTVAALSGPTGAPDASSKERERTVQLAESWKGAV
jgi:hypothetical protein